MKGLLAEPYFCGLILPDKKDFLPAITAYFIDSAIKIGFLAFAIAVLINTQSHPSTVAIEASDAVPIPASTITGTFQLFIIIDKFNLFLIPLPDPIGEASGMIADAPRSSNFFAIIGSSEQ